MRPILSRLLAGALLASFAAVSLAHAAAITPQAKSALEAALEDEYKAEAFYAATIAKFGEVKPFINIIKAEQTHARELGAVMQRYGMDKSTNPYLNDAAIAAAVPETLAEVCAMGVDAELANRDLYDKKLMPAVTDFPDIKAVFVQLRDASEDKHLPAFQRCGGGHGQGMGQGIGHSMGKGMGKSNP